MHQKRNEIPISWPVPRKGTKFLVVPTNNKKKAIPVLVLMRDFLKIAKNKKEVKKIIHEDKVKVNEKIIKDEKFALLLFDIISIGDKTYRLVLNNKKFRLDETKDRTKPGKIIGKKILAGNKIQINLNDGRNFLVSEKTKVGDSVIIDFKTNKILRIVPLKENSEIIVIRGKRTGDYGKVGKIDEKNKIAEVAFDKEKASLKLNNIMAIK